MNWRKIFTKKQITTLWLVIIANLLLFWFSGHSDQSKPAKEETKCSDRREREVVF